MITTLQSTQTTPDDLKLQHLLDILPEDLHTDTLIEYEPSIIFQAIKESCLEIMFSPKIQKTYIYSFHSSVYKILFMLRNLTHQTMHLEEKIVALVIVHPPRTQSNNVTNLQQLSNKWDSSLNLNGPPLTTPSMIFLLWNCIGIKNQSFKMHFKELLAYHKPAIVVLIETKLGGEEADSIMTSFNYPHCAKVDADGAAGGIYIIWND